MKASRKLPKREIDRLRHVFITHNALFVIIPECSTKCFSVSKLSGKDKSYFSSREPRGQIQQSN